MISRAVPRSNRRQAATEQPHPVGSPVATGDRRRDGPHHDESAHGAAMRARSYHEVITGPLLQPTGRHRPSEHAPFRRLALEGVRWTARTEVLLGESPHDPGARCAGPSASVRTHSSQHRGHLRGFGWVPGFSPGVAPDGGDARSPPPQPHRDGASGSTRRERRARRRAAATPSPPASTIRQSVKPRRTPTARSGAAWPQPRCSKESPPSRPLITS